VKQILKWDSLFNFKGEVVPTRTVVPEWYKKIPKNVIIPGDSNTKSAKHCVPFLDSLTVGYSICLMTDLYVERDQQGAPLLRFSEPEAGPNARHSIQTDPMPVPHGYEPYYWTWLTRHCIELPEGYSAVYCHPLNRFDLPFITVSAIIDNDSKLMGGNYPFFLREGFEGLIPKGTPIVQVIPFLREDWKQEHVPGMAQIGRDYEMNASEGWYKNIFWRKKSYK
jgi:hypothetical protein